MEEKKRKLERELQRNFDNPILHRLYADLLDKINEPTKIYYYQFIADPTNDEVWEDEDRALTEKTIFEKANASVQDYVDEEILGRFRGQPELLDILRQLTHLSGIPSLEGYEILMNLLNEINPDTHHQICIIMEKIDI